MAEEYIQLLESYRRMFGMVDVFHFNSQNTADVYSKYLDIPKESQVIPITHTGIQDRRRKRNFDMPVLRIGFIGSEAPYKGFPMLKEVISQLNDEGYFDKVSLSVYGGRKGIDELAPNVSYKGRYTSSMMEEIFNDMDMLIVPSIWFETFSLVTLEALSFGTPVLVSDRVGAKDIVKKHNPNFVFGSKNELYKIIIQIVHNREVLKEFNKSVLATSWEWSMEEHAKEIVSKLYLINM